MTGQQLTLELDFFLERPRALPRGDVRLAPSRGWAPCVSPRWGRVHLWRGGRWRKVRTIRLAAGGRWL